MNATAQLKELYPRPVHSVASCTACPANELGVCSGLAEDGDRRQVSAPALLSMSEHAVPARRVIFRQRDLHEVVPFICRGWAACAVTLSDGSRQILSFLLPGDIVSASLLFAPAAHCSVEAITDVQYRCFRRDELRAHLLGDPEAIEKVARLWTERELRACNLAVDLGRRTADERIARLILNLRERLASRGLTQGRTMEFPLRQHHVADAIGLTAVHVSKVMSEFRRRGLIEISDRSLTILDEAEFQRVATMR